MTDIAPFSQAIVVALVAVPAGLLVGVIYFRSLQAAIELFAQGRGWTLPLALSLARFAGLVAAMSLAARHGATALIACFLGFLLARAIAVRSVPEAR